MILEKARPCKLQGNFFAILDFSGHKNWSDLSFPPDILVNYAVLETYQIYIISLSKFGLEAYVLRSLSIWGFTFGSDQTFVTEITLVIGNLSWLKQTSRFCRKLIHVSCKITFLPFQALWYKNRSDLSFPLDILVN